MLIDKRLEMLSNLSNSLGVMGAEKVKNAHVRKTQARKRLFSKFEDIDYVDCCCCSLHKTAQAVLEGRLLVVLG